MTLPNLIIIYTGQGKGKTTAALGLALRAIRDGMKVNLIQFIKSEKGSGEAGLRRVLPGLKVKCFGTGFVSQKAQKAQKTQKTQKHFRDSQTVAKEGIGYCVRLVKSTKFNVLILDEIFVALDLKLIKESDIVRVIREFRKGCQDVRLSECNKQNSHVCPPCHPDENRDPGEDALDIKSWIPAFAGMTIRDDFRSKHKNPKNVKVLLLTGRGCPKSLYKYADLVTEMKEVKHPFQQGVYAIKGIDY